MTRTTKLLAALAATTFLVAPAMAAEVPEGVTLAEDQSFTYRVLDEHSSVDPQIVEDVSGSEIVRDLFEGLLNQSADGELVAAPDAANVRLVEGGMDVGLHGNGAPAPQAVAGWYGPASMLTRFLFRVSWLKRTLPSAVANSV